MTVIVLLMLNKNVLEKKLIVSDGNDSIKVKKLKMKANFSVVCCLFSMVDVVDETQLTQKNVGLETGCY